MPKVFACVNLALVGALLLLAMVQPATQSFSQTTTVAFPKTGENVVLVSSGRHVTVGFIPAELLGYPMARRTFTLGRSLHWAHAPGNTFSAWSDLNTDDLEPFQEATRQKALSVLRNPRSATDPAECRLTAADDVRAGPSFWVPLLLLGAVLAAINLARLPALRNLRVAPNLAVPDAPRSLRESLAHSIRSIRHFSFKRDHSPSRQHHATPWHVRLHHAARDAVRNGRDRTSGFFTDWRTRSPIGSAMRDLWYRIRG